MTNKDNNSGKKQQMFLSLVYWRNRKKFVNLIVKFLADEISIFYFAEKFKDLLCDQEEIEELLILMEKEEVINFGETETLKIIYFRIMLDKIERIIIELLDILSNDIELDSSLFSITIYPESSDPQLPFPLIERIKEFKKELVKIFFRSQFIKDSLLNI